jgi:hypothetical protein
MLGDTAEKSKNPIKSAMRRRKAKTVTFTASTLVEYEEPDYSTEEEDSEASHTGQQDSAEKQQQQDAAQRSADEPQDESAKVQPLKPKSKQVQLEPLSAEDKEMEISADDARTSDEIFEQPELQNRTTKNGTVRNTDSFFKDETVETKKITLTPNLLRDDNDPRVSNDSAKEMRQRPSMEKLEKELFTDKEKGKEDKKKKDKEKKEKEKKPSAIRSFFSRKDKKKSNDEDDDSLGKRSMESSFAEPEPELVAAEAEPSPEKPAAAPQRNPSKLQKHQPRTEPSPTRKPSSATPQSNTMALAEFLSSDGKPNHAPGNPATSMRMVEPDALDDAPPPKEDTSKPAVSKMLHTAAGAKPPKVSKATSRIELDDFDSSEEDEAEETPVEVSPPPTRPAPVPDAQARPTKEDKSLRPTLPGAYPDSYLSSNTVASQQASLAVQAATAAQPSERLSESPVQVSPVTSSNPPALMGDNSSQEDRSSPMSTPSPELVEVGGRGHHNQDSVTTTSTTSTTATTTSTWNDNHLRSYFDSGADVRDLLLVVYDKTDVPPAGPDHPIVGPLFREQNAKLAEITTVSNACPTPIICSIDTDVSLAIGQHARRLAGPKAENARHYMRLTTAGLCHPMPSSICQYQTACVAFSIRTLYH